MNNLKDFANETKETPIYAHDCDRCKFLGCYNGQDLYYCPPYDPKSRPKRWGLISRYGVHGDYCSGGWKTANPQMLEARKRAVAAGYIGIDDYAQA